ncbi:uncharacterized protein [Alexandromys fortis]|uniref:uncharacterized protein n=1 Tax=Alexandromys fortis TaxID=100897 RepID=UPI002152D729|nr:uncharacterized protein LOC126494912 [Microtus fortis]
MSDEEITYTSVRFGKSSELQTQGRHDETQGPRQTVHRECLVPRYLIAISLGILCSLLVAIAVLVAYVSQYSGNNHVLQKTLNNLTQQYQTLQSNNTLMKETLNNKSREFDDLKHQKELDSCNRRCGETKVSDCIKFTGKYVDGSWFCSDIKCYFSMDKKDWSGCIRTCQDCSLSLLKIDDDDELKFLQIKINPSTYWIGLSYNTGKSQWQWIDNGPFNLDSKIANLSHKTRRCAFLSRTRLDYTKCENCYPCICETRMDKLPKSPSSKKERNHSRSGFKAKHTLLTIKMSDEEITYTTVRFGKSSKLQTRGTKDEIQEPRGTVHRECVVPRYLIAISLGILCSLLVAVTVLVAYVSQYSGSKHELQKTLNNLTQQYYTLQSTNSLTKEMLRNKSRELEDFKHQKALDSNREQNRCCGETKVLDFIQFTGKYVDGYWFCSGIKCYFIMDNKHWSGCKQTCQNCSLSLLKIDDDDELKFLQDKVVPNNHWIGLSYSARNIKWQWIDNGTSNLDLMTVKSLQRSGGCATFSFKGINPYDCGRIYPCICENRYDKFPHLVCSREEK